MCSNHPKFGVLDGKMVKVVTSNGGIMELDTSILTVVCL